MPSIKPWFKAKKYGWGWTPQTVEGYLTLLIYIVLFVGLTIIFAQRLTDPLFAPLVSTAIFVILTALLILSLLVICYAKGEKPSWHWGNKSKR